jgi:hypothetical protein
LPTGRATPPAPSADIRAAVRTLLGTSADFHTLDAETKKTIAGAMVRIADTARALASESEVPASARQPLARAMTAGSDYSGVTASRVADTTRAVLNAVSFPRFVTELINGVFKALNDSNQQQLASYIELIQNVSSTLDGFADANVGVSGARSWLAEHFPGSFVVQGDEDMEPTPGMSADERRELQEERDASTRLRLVPGGSMPSAAALKSAFGLGPEEEAPATGDPESLVPLARSALARNRQKMLSTMVMMGMQRIVIESGKLNASMRFHIDTRSAAAADAGSSFDTRTNMDVSGGAKFGPWGMEAKVQSTIGYVSTQRSQTTEEMNTDLDLSSNVELIFKTDYVQLDRLAGGPTQERIRVNAMNPEAEARLASDARTARRNAEGTAEAARGSQLKDSMARPGALPASTTKVPAQAPAQPPASSPPKPTTPPPKGTQTTTPATSPAGTGTTPTPTSTATRSTSPPPAARPPATAEHAAG